MRQTVLRRNQVVSGIAKSVTKVNHLLDFVIFKMDTHGEEVCAAKYEQADIDWRRNELPI